MKQKKYEGMWSHLESDNIENKEDLMSIGFIQAFQRYEIQEIVFDVSNHDGVISCKAYGNEFVIKPHNGQYDWELLLRRLERAKHGNFVTIVRKEETE